MQHAYNELYLDKATASLAGMLDFAARDLRYDAGQFFDLFISSGVAALFGQGDVRTIAGMSGVELAYNVLEKSGIEQERAGYRYTASRSKEYWTGWALARYQWEHAIPFTDIVSAVPVPELISICNDYRENEIRELSEGLSWMDTVKVPDHMSEDNYNDFSVKLSHSIAGQSGIANLKRLRQLSGLSQSRLASLSGVPVRTIQQYEQRQKDINKASFESIIKLAAALSCEPSDLTEHTL